MIAGYTLFGIVFGLVFPVAGLTADYLVLRPDVGSVGDRIKSNPIHGIVALAPFVLGVVFHVIGRIQCALREKNDDLKHALLLALHADTAKETVLAATADAIICVDERGLIVTFNTSAEEIFGYRADEVIGQPVRVLLPAAGAKLFEDYVAAYSPEREAQILSQRPTLEGKRKSGAFFPMELGLKRSSHDGHAIYVGVVRDITERRQVEAMKNDFIATVSHELRTPLTSIYGPLSILRSGKFGTLSDVGHRTVEIALRNCDHLMKLINNLLDFEKIASGRLALQLGDSDVMRLVCEAVQDNEGYAMSCGVSVGLRGAADVGHVHVDEERFGQVLRNLLSNALKFSDRGGARRSRRHARAGPRGRVGDRCRCGDSAGQVRPHLPAVFTGRRLFGAQQQRHRPGTGHQQGTDRTDGRADRLYLVLRRRVDLLGVLPRGAAAGAARGTGRTASGLQPTPRRAPHRTGDRGSRGIASGPAGHDLTFGFAAYQERRARPCHPRPLLRPKGGGRARDKGSARCGRGERGPPPRPMRDQKSQSSSSVATDLPIT